MKDLFSKSFNSVIWNFSQKVSCFNFCRTIVIIFTHFFFLELNWWLYCLRRNSGLALFPILSSFSPMNSEYVMSLADNPSLLSASIPDNSDTLLILLLPNNVLILCLLLFVPFLFNCRSSLVASNEIFLLVLLLTSTIWKWKSFSDTELFIRLLTNSF